MILGIFLSPGVKDVTSVLLPSKEKAAAGEEKFESLPAVPGMTRRDSQSTVHSRDGCTLATKHRFVCRLQIGLGTRSYIKYVSLKG